MAVGLGICILIALITVALLLTRKMRNKKLQRAGSASVNPTELPDGSGRSRTPSEIDGSIETQRRRPELDGLAMLEMG